MELDIDDAHGCLDVESLVQPTNRQGAFHYSEVSTYLIHGSSFLVWWMGAIVTPYSGKQQKSTVRAAKYQLLEEAPSLGLSKPMCRPGRGGTSSANLVTLPLKVLHRVAAHLDTPKHPGGNTFARPNVKIGALASVVHVLCAEVMSAAEASP